MFFFLFVVLPLIELFLLTRVSAHIGLQQTILLVIVTGILGGRLARGQGRVAWRKVQSAMAEGRLPTREAIEAILVLIAGVLLVTPGVITDAVGLLMLIAPIRTLMTPFVHEWLKKKIQFSSTHRPGPQGPWQRGASRSNPAAHTGPGDVSNPERGEFDPFHARERGRVVDVDPE